MQFRTQTAWVSVSNCVIQTLIAVYFSWLMEWYWCWIFPALMLAILPRSLKQCWVIIDEERVRFGQSTVLKWDDVESLHERHWSRTIFLLKNGEKQSVSTFDWPREYTQRFHALLKEKGI